ncbi:MAG: hypothetical protein WCK31_00440 [bacterium]
MPSAEKVKAFKCKTCNGLGKLQDGTNCTYCLGSGYIGNDGTYEYILKQAENGKFVITDIKLPNAPDYDFDKNANPNTEPAQTNLPKMNTPNNGTNNSEEWNKKMKNLRVSIVNSMLIIGIIVIALLYVFVFKEEKALISLGIILLCLFIVFNIGRTSIFDSLREIVSKNWNEPKDYVYFLREKRKKESE